MSDPDFVYPRFHITRTVRREDGNLEEEAVTPPVCDCCFDRRVRWEVDCEEFTLEGDIEFGSTGEWGLCDVCADLTQKRLPLALSHRIAASWAITRGERKKGDLVHAMLLVDAFFAHITSDVRPFG